MQNLFDRDLWLEAALWLVFAFVLVQYANNGEGDLITLAGLIGLVAIGVRATRTENGAPRPDEKPDQSPSEARDDQEN